MQKIRDQIETFILQADRKWKALPGNRQRFFTKLFFAGYAALTLLMLINIVISTESKTNSLLIGHITAISDHTDTKKVADANSENAPLKKIKR